MAEEEKEILMESQGKRERGRSRGERARERANRFWCGDITAVQTEEEEEITEKFLSSLLSASGTDGSFCPVYLFFSFLPFIPTLLLFLATETIKDLR